ncbi:MAG TPA: LysM peptidoglycan-binding domain-containing protein, partial [Candidatus Sulfotelmatobacter sp.]|nr:LysM peptidoglycan-binding domain-containing protein [Candidatus Sulfotelmatobacter sp.]
TLEQKTKGRTRVKIAVFVVLAIHGVGLLALLMQGCKPNTPQENPPPPVETNAAPSTESTNLASTETNLEPSAAAPQTNLSAPSPALPENTTPPPPTAPSAALSQTPPALPGSGTEYTVAKGDTLAGIAKKSGVSIKALTEANPGVQPTKLKIGQKLQIPAGGGATPTASTTGGSAAAPTQNTGGGQTYTVKSGDTLTKVASRFSVSVKALRAANKLKTDSIKVGQKLKIPAKTASRSAAPAGASTPAAPASMPEPGMSTPPPAGQ